MNAPTRTDALEAADVFFTALNVVLFHQKKQHVENDAIAQAAANFRASGICATMADAMDVDADRLDRVAYHLIRKRLTGGTGKSAEYLDRLLGQLKNSQSIRN